ncbi:Rho GTPase activation protein, partial [Syncephalis pseudoplumigaleata]
QPVFGVPLERAIEVSRVKEGFECPAVVYRTIEYLEAKQAEHEEGIYRLSGMASGEYYDVHAVAGVLKMYLRELPINVLTRELHPHFLKVLG